MKEEIVGTIPSKSEEIQSWEWGDLQLEVKRSASELWLRHRYHKEQPESDEDTWYDESADWSRWPLDEGMGELHFSLLMPDLPVVISSKYPIHLQPGEQIQVFVGIPVWLHISLASEHENIKPLLELPSQELKKTWFGTPLDGELSYWKESNARLGLQPVGSSDHLVYCPIQIINEADDLLTFTKFIFRVESLSIYQVREEYWADETIIHFKGGGNPSDIDMTGKLPPSKRGKNTKKLTPPRKPARKNISLRTFQSLF